MCNLLTEKLDDVITEKSHVMKDFFSVVNTTATLKTKTETEAPKHKHNVNIIESQIKPVMYHE